MSFHGIAGVISVIPQKCPWKALNPTRGSCFLNNKFLANSRQIRHETSNIDTVLTLLLLHHPAMQLHFVPRPHAHLTKFCIAPSQSCKRRLRLCIRAEKSSQIESMKNLVVVGSINADMVLQIERMPEEGETLAASSLQTFPGGKGANQAAAAGRLGYKTHFLGQVCCLLHQASRMGNSSLPPVPLWKVRCLVPQTFATTFISGL